MMLFSFVLLLLLATLPLSADSNSDAQQLLDASEHQANVFENQSPPFQMDVDFNAEIKWPVAGHLTLQWQDKNHWRRKIVMGDFEQTEVRNGEMLYTSRNLDFTPIRADDVVELIQFADWQEKLIVKKQQKKNDDGMQLECLQVGRQGIKGDRLDICLNPTSHEIVSEEWKGNSDDKRVSRYTDYFGFRGNRYPKTLALFVNGSKVINATVTNQASISFVPAFLNPPPNAIARRHCEGMKYPVPIKTPDPLYPQSAAQNHLGGQVTVSLTVQTDGSVSDIHLAETATGSMDDATLQALKKWRFKPAMCGNEPVVSDIHVIVNFRLVR